MDSIDSFTLTFTSDGKYTASITGDATGEQCIGSTDCTHSGTYSATSSTITIDDSDPVDYSISGNVLTMSGTPLSGIDIEYRFVRA